MIAKHETCGKCVGVVEQIVVIIEVRISHLKVFRLQLVAKRDNRVLLK